MERFIKFVNILLSMISDEPIRLVRIRPHHVGFFSEYYINEIYLDRYLGEVHKYGRKFVAEVKKNHLMT